MCTGFSEAAQRRLGEGGTNRKDAGSRGQLLLLFIATPRPTPKQQQQTVRTY